MQRNSVRRTHSGGDGPDGKRLRRRGRRRQLFGGQFVDRAQRLGGVDGARQTRLLRRRPVPDRIVSATPFRGTRRRPSPPPTNPLTIQFTKTRPVTVYAYPSWSQTAVLGKRLVSKYYTYVHFILVYYFT